MTDTTKPRPAFDREAIEERLKTRYIMEVWNDVIEDMVVALAEIDRLHVDRSQRLALADAAWRDRVEELKAEIDRLTALHRAAVEVLAEHTVTIEEIRDYTIEDFKSYTYRIYSEGIYVRTTLDEDMAREYAHEYAESLIQARVAAEEQPK